MYGASRLPDICFMNLMTTGGGVIDLVGEVMRHHT